MPEFCDGELEPYTKEKVHEVTITVELNGSGVSRDYKINDSDLEYFIWQSNIADMIDTLQKADEITL